MTAVLDTLSRLVAFPTVSDQPLTEMAAWLAERAETSGFRVERFETSPGKHNVVASAGPAGEDGLVLSGHMDVVPTEGQPWSSDPFRLTERDGHVYARGACDMKGFIASAVEAAARVDLSRLRRELVLVWTHDEEVGCKGSAALATQLEGRPLPSLAVIGEPTDFRVCRMHPGHLTLEVRCSGVPAHSSRPELGASAIRVASRALDALWALESELRAERAFEGVLESPWPVMNVGTIEGGAAVNIVPDRCVIRLGVRPLPGQDIDALIARFAYAIARVDDEARAWGGGARLSPLHLAPPLLTEEDTPLERLLRPHACAGAAGAVPFATDGGNLARLGVRSLIFGPGSIDVAHRPDEHVAIADLVRTTDILEDLIQRRCGKDATEGGSMVDFPG